MAQVGADLDAGRSASEREAIHRQELDLKQKVAMLEKQIELLDDDKDKSQPDKIAKRQKLREDLAKARTELYEHYRDQRASSPVYRQLLSTSSGPPRLSVIQRRLAGKDGILLAYLLGSEGGYLLAIAPDKVELTPLAFDDAAAKTLGVKAGPLTANRLGDALIGADGSGVVQQLRDPAKAGDATDKLAVLWRVLVPQSQRDMLTGGKVKRLIVVPDGKLALLPFETLVVKPGQKPQYLLDVGPAIEYGPSATVLYNLTSRAVAVAVAGREPILTVGNPNYSSQGPQLAGDLNSTLNQIASRSRYGTLGGKLSPLPYSGWESAWVADAFDKAGIKTIRLEGSGATKAKLRAEIEGRRIIHLACHGLADQSYGNFYGALALAVGDKPDDPSDDGYLTLSEIYGLNLHGVELTILSACETNYGPQQQGEGVWALSRGFLVAGSRRVVASNWLVDDEAAATLVSFYCGNLAQAEHKGGTVDYADSLLKAKRWVRAQEKWSSPFYWATLVLVGPN
jgi:CHAT domain-containing protein